MTGLDGEALLRGLIGQMPLADFNRDVRERRVGRFERAIPPDVVERLFNLARFEALIGMEAPVAPYVDIFDEQHLRRLVDVQKKSGKSCLAVAAECFAAGATIRIRDADKFDLPLTRFTADIQRMLEADSQVNLYLTPPARDGFPPHFDITDVFVIQCVGTKEWRLYPDYTNQQELPLAETNWEPERYRPLGTGQALTLSAGDVLYLPRGTMHQASCTDRESLHLTISIEAVTVVDMLIKAVRRAAETDINLRRRFPWPPPVAEEEDEVIGVLEKTLPGLQHRVDLKALVRAEYPVRTAKAREEPGRFESVISDLLESARTTGENDPRPTAQDLKTGEAS